MIICEDCRQEFELEEAIKILEPHEFWGGIVNETFYACPFCKSREIKIHNK